MRSLADSAFQRVFQNTFVYNILYEDSEVDERFLELDPSSRVLGISGAGCRIAGHLSQNPRHVDAVDINRHHLALTALKVEAARSMTSYEQFYELLGHGSIKNPGTVIGKLATQLPAPQAAHWKRHHKMFSKRFFSNGLTAQCLRVLQHLTGVNQSWLNRLSRMDVEERKREVRTTFSPILQDPWVKWAIESPVNLLALGVNFAQCDRILKMEGVPDIAGLLLAHMQKLVTTDLARNWFAWHAVVGHYNHEDQQAIPPFLRRDRHERSIESKTRVAYHNRNIFDVLGEAPAANWSHFTFCDAPDWMDDATQKQLFSEVVRTGRDGGVLQYRTVERESLVGRHGLGSHLHELTDATRVATEIERTRFFRGVRYYRIVH